MKTKILLNAAKCLRCGDEIYSTSWHDFKVCSCGEIFIDGGLRYLRSGSIHPENFQDMSIREDITDEKEN